MKKRLLTIALLTAMLPTVTYSQSSSAQTKQSQILEAVMKVYEDELAKNPNDYAVLYSRANQYFMMGENLKALQDVNAALNATTRDDKETLTDEYVLRAKIYKTLGNARERLNDLIEAYRLSPKSDAIRAELAEAYYDNADYEMAEKLYTQQLRINSLDYSAMAGLAKVEVQKKNYGKAAEYVDQAVKLYPAESEVYINRADVLMMLGQPESAAQDLISALSVNGDATSSLKRLTKMANTNYDAVIAALGNSMKKAPNVGMFYYIRAAIEIDHNHYADALRDLEAIIANNLYEYHGIYHDAAICSFNLNKMDDALRYVDKAIAASPDVKYYITKARILMAQNHLADADMTARSAQASAPGETSILRLRAEIAIADDRAKQALSLLGEAIVKNPQDVESLLLRAWLQRKVMNRSTAAENDFATIISLGAEQYTWRGMALHGMRRDADAASWCDKIVADGILPGGESYYMAAVVMAQCGNADKALSYLESALANGYGSRYNLEQSSIGYLNLKPLRSNPRFATLLKRYASAFEPNQSR